LVVRGQPEKLVTVITEMYFREGYFVYLVVRSGSRGVRTSEKWVTGP
jgi:hypothetical protein